MTDDEITYVSERSLELIELHGGALSSHMGPGVSEYTLTYSVPFFLLAAALNGAIPDHETLDRLIDVGSGRIMCQVLEDPEASREEFEELYQAIRQYLSATMNFWGLHFGPKLKQRSLTWSWLAKRKLNKLIKSDDLPIIAMLNDENNAKEFLEDLMDYFRACNLTARQDVTSMAGRGEAQ